MKKIAATVLALAMFAMAAPSAVAEDVNVREENREWILEQNPDFVASEIVEVHHNGIVEEMTAEDALEIALDRAGDRLLENLVAEESHGTAELVGDIWLIGSGSVDCGTTTSENVGAGLIPVDPQLWVYGYDAGYNTGASATFWTATAFTMKDSAAGSGAINYGGLSDFFCIGGSFFGLLFPFIDGYTTTEAVPPA